MGQSVSQHSIQQQYDIVKAFQDGSALLRHRKNNEQFLLRSICSSIPEEINGLEQLLKKRQILKSPHLLDLVQIRRKQQKNICSVVHKMYLLIEYPFRTLKDEIIDKSSRGKITSFLQAELWSILYSCCVGLNTLYQKKISHQCLTSKQIFISQDGLIKISDPLLLGLQKNYIRILKKQYQHIHVSPQIINFLDDCNFSFYDKQKSDVFILGVILLEASVLRPIELFQRQTKKPLLDLIPKVLKEVKAKYSQSYYEMLRKMLQCHSKLRPRLLQIINTIEQENNFAEVTEQTSTQNLNMTTESLKNNKNQKSVRTIPKGGNWNQPSLSKQSSSHQLNVNANQKNSTMKVYQSQYERSRSQAENQTIIKMLNTQNMKVYQSNMREGIVPQKLQYISTPQQPQPQSQSQLQYQYQFPPQNQQQSQASPHLQSQPQFIMNNNIYVKQNPGYNNPPPPNFVQYMNPSQSPANSIHALQQGQKIQQINLSQNSNKNYTPVPTIVNQVPNPQQLEQNDRFSYTKFGKISLHPQKLKSKPVFSYDIPQINQILKSQSSSSLNNQPIKNKGQESQQNNNQIKQIQTIKNIPEPYSKDMNNLKMTKKQIVQASVEKQVMIPQLKFSNCQEALPNSDSPPQYYKNGVQSKISLNGILKQNSAKQNNIIFPVTQKSEQNYETSPAKIYTNKNSAYKLNQPQKSPGVESNQHDEKYNQGQSHKSGEDGSKFVVLCLEGGGRYEGYMKNGMKNGQGRLEFNDGGYYTGQWKDNKMHGYGKLHYQNGQVAYEGNWQSDEFCGFGRIFNDKPEKLMECFNYYDFADLGQKWIYYEGQFKNDSKHGKGKIRLTNGEVFQGNFVFDSIEGQGTFYTIKGEAVRGLWKDNMLIEK